MTKKDDILNSFEEGFQGGYEHFRKQLLEILDEEIAGAGMFTRKYFQQARDRVANLKSEDFE